MEEFTKRRTARRRSMNIMAGCLADGGWTYSHPYSHTTDIYVKAEYTLYLGVRRIILVTPNRVHRFRTSEAQYETIAGLAA